jgi:hypothetical protein
VVALLPRDLRPRQKRQLPVTPLVHDNTDDFEDALACLQAEEDAEFERWLVNNNYSLRAESRQSWRLLWNRLHSAGRSLTLPPSTGQKPLEL